MTTNPVVLPEKIYAVIEIQYKHNGDYYEAQGYYAPVKSFRNRESAEKLLEEYICDFFRRVTLCKYAEYIEDVISNEGIEILIEILPILSVHDEIAYDPQEVREDFPTLSRVFHSAVNSMSWDKLKDLMDNIYLDPWRIEEVDLV